MRIDQTKQTIYWRLKVKFSQTCSMKSISTIKLGEVNNTTGAERVKVSVL